MTDIDIQLTQATLGMDQLYRAQKGGSGVLDREGLVPVILTDLLPTKFADWDEADAHLLDLANQVTRVNDAMRRDYLVEMIESLHGLVATSRGDAQTYLERVEQCLRVSAKPVSLEAMDHYRGEIDRLLRKLGYTQGTLDGRVTRWESDNQVPRDQVENVLRGLLIEARRRTEEKMFALPDIPFEPVGVSGVPFSAYCDYLGRQLRVNVDMRYTRSALKHLACHEGYPGHLVHLAVREERTKSGAMPIDAALVVTNSASSAIFEGIGENGIYFLDWIESPEDELAMTLNRLRSSARMNAALMIHHESKPLEQVKAYLQETCFATPAWVESRIAFLTHSLRAPFIFAYWCGDMGVDHVWQRVKPNHRQAFFQHLYYHMHTTMTLAKYWPVQD